MPGHSAKVVAARARAWASRPELARARALLAMARVARGEVAEERALEACHNARLEPPADEQEGERRWEYSAAELRAAGILPHLDHLYGEALRERWERL